jgi:tripartite-type tricarboxylate transporter receptor subunit TctC
MPALWDVDYRKFDSRALLTAGRKARVQHIGPFRMAVRSSRFGYPPRHFPRTWSMSLRSFAARVPSFVVSAVAIALVAVGVATPARAQSDFPKRAVSLVLPFPPGGIADTVARKLAERLAVSWNVPVVVENKAGAAGNIGAAGVAKSAPDGHTLLVTVTDGLVIAAASKAQVGYDPLKDLEPVALASLSSTVLVANAASPLRTFNDVVTYAKQNPGKLNFGTNGIGSSFHLNLEQIKAASGVDITHVPYKGGAQVVTDLVAGRLDLTIVTAFLAAPQIQAGKMRAIALASAQRSAMLPGVPTIAESSIPGFDSPLGMGVFAPAGTPPALIDRINNDVRKAMAAPEVRNSLAQTDTINTNLTAAEFKARFQREVATLAQLIAKSNLKFE